MPVEMGANQSRRGSYRNPRYNYSKARRRWENQIRLSADNETTGKMEDDLEDISPRATLQTEVQLSKRALRERKKRKEMIPAASPQVLPPMPEFEEVNRRFEEILKMMDLPPQKAKVLRSYDLQKKWELICDQEKVTDKGPPSVYLEKLRIYLDPKGTKKKKKILGDETSTNILKHLEICLRTNSIDWVREFLNNENKGLEVLVQYLRYTQDCGGLQNPHAAQNGDSSASTVLSLSLSRTNDGAAKKNRSLSVSKSHNMGDPEDDVHICIQCVRAIMNNTHGFNMVFNDQEAIYCLVRGILHPSLRTKSSVLVLLAAICLVKGGHDLIVEAFDRFKREYHEDRRFETLFSFFRDYDEFHVDFMVACMQFINIVVHSVEEMNYRIFLQHEFKLMGLDEYLEKLKTNESEELQVQISAYLENMYDVGQLLDDSEQKAVLQQQLEGKEHELSRTLERLQEIEEDYMMKMAKLDTRLAALMAEKEDILSKYQKTDIEVNTLRKDLNLKEQEARQNQSKLESRIQELESLQRSFRAGDISLSPGGPHPPAPIPPPPPPAPPLLSPIPGGPRPPPPPPPPPPANFPNAPAVPQADAGFMTIKRRIQTRYKLPQLNWVPLKPNQVKGTVFADMDDEKVMGRIDFNEFEETFKMGVNPLGAVENNPMSLNTSTGPLSSATRKHEDTLLDHKRLRNLAITRRKLNMEPADVIRAVNNFDLSSMDLENVEILLRVLPTPEEAKMYKDYESAQKPLSNLSEEDKFMMQLCKAERIGHKLQIMSFMGNFEESANLILPSLTTITAASKAVKDAKHFHKLLELILAYGNYMNSGKRGGVFGFKLQSLDTLAFLKAPGVKNVTLLHAIAQSVQEKFPDLANFAQELRFIEKASTISMESVLSDLAELEKGYELIKKEFSLRGQDAPQVLVKFLNKCETKMSELREYSRVAQDAFRDCVEFYSENSKTTSTNSFFSTLVNFVKHYNQAHEENLARKRAEAVEQAKSVPSPPRNTAEDFKRKQAAVIGELQGRGNENGQKPRVAGKPPGKREPAEMGLGTLDDIISEIKHEPYRTTDAVSAKRRSFKDRTAMELSRNRPTPSETAI